MLTPLRLSAATAVLLLTLAPGAASPDNATPDAEAAGFEAILAGLDEARRIVDANSVPGSAERAEGYRFILRRIEHNLGELAYDSDPAHPIVSRCRQSTPGCWPPPSDQSTMPRCNVLQPA